MEPVEWARKALDIIESETRDLVHSGAPTRKSETGRGHCATCSENRSHIDCRSRKNDRRVANGKRFSGIRGGEFSARRSTIPPSPRWRRPR